MNNIRYDRIGKGYDGTRRADPYLAERMYQLLKSDSPNAVYLDVGCGTGNYTVSLANRGMTFKGLEPSNEMLDKARKKDSTVDWMHGRAEDIPLPGNSVDGVLVSLSIHHWKDLKLGFQEIHRVLKKGGKMVLFTTLPEQTKAYWLNHYFPRMIDDSIHILPTWERIEEAYQHAGLQVTAREKYFVQPDLDDWFLYCGKHRPEMYFREDVRSGISSFSLLSNREEVEKGLSQLRNDIDSDHITDIMQQHENELGDYLFVVAEKNQA